MMPFIQSSCRADYLRRPLSRHKMVQPTLHTAYGHKRAKTRAIQRTPLYVGMVTGATTVRALRNERRKQIRRLAERVNSVKSHRECTHAYATAGELSFCRTHGVAPRRAKGEIRRNIREHATQQSSVTRWRIAAASCRAVMSPRYAACAPHTRVAARRHIRQHVARCSSSSHAAVELLYALCVRRRHAATNGEAQGEEETPRNTNSTI